MSQRSIIAILSAFIVIAMLTGGCKKGCPTCHSYGYNSTYNNYTTQICSNNTCTCPNGFEGDSCQILSVTKYIQPSPSWQAFDGCSGVAGSYYVSMTSDYNIYSRFYINGLFNLGGTVAVDIYSSANNTSTNLNIAQQQVGGTVFYGTGFYQLVNGLGKITLNMDYSSGGVEQNCTVTLYQQ